MHGKLNSRVELEVRVTVPSLKGAACIPISGKLVVTALCRSNYPERTEGFVKAILRRKILNLPGSTNRLGNSTRHISQVTTI